MHLNYDLLPKSDRQKIREEMIEQMVLILTHDGPQCSPAQRRSSAVKLVNQALARERQKRKPTVQ